ncbi:MAG: hypothetical protein LUC24_02700 [Bacteroidales bacterium]|nr:hypothetical protein [Bacteroidales bacterium]
MYINDPQLKHDDSEYMTTAYQLSMAGVSWYEKERMTGSWRIAYAYNFTRLFALEGGLSYEGYRDAIFNSDTGSRISRYHGDMLTLMATLRVSWLNRKVVRVYSSAGVGVSWLLGGGNYSFSDGPRVSYPLETRVAWQVVPVGMSIGRSLYGIVELGVGSVFVGGRFGVGYRF